MNHIFFILIVLVCGCIILADSIYLSKTEESLTTIDETSAMTTSYDTKFHDSAEDIQQQTNVYIPASQKIDVVDASGNPIKIEIPKLLATSTYYKPGLYKYSANSYVPSYEDSIYLSRSIGVVPRLDGEYYLPSSGYRLNSIETPYDESDSLISPEWTAVTPDGKLHVESSDNVNYAVTDDKLSQLRVTYTMTKNAEELDYENRLAKLLNVQDKIVSYATDAPLNVQQKLTPSGFTSSSVAPTTTILYTPTPLPMIKQQNKKDIYKLPTGAPISSSYLLGVSDQ
jgi:hypothetical protein